MNLEDINQETLGNIVGASPESLAYNMRDAHERGYFETAETVGDICAAYVGYLTDMLAGLNIKVATRGAFGPEALVKQVELADKTRIVLPGMRG